ncbi:phosphatase PAP2 family protein [Pleurocapsales cyanobacterium LEGE 06147]|nr:phosphatase PAP2 family protein [Pleurocapsales cyanobacterium LEGE 06147]
MQLSFYYWLVDPWTGRQLGLLISFSYGFNILCKEFFDYPRPFELNPSVASPEAIATIENSSFPSGHAQSSATFWLYVALRHQRLWL